MHLGVQQLWEMNRHRQRLEKKSLLCENAIIAPTIIFHGELIASTPHPYEKGGGLPKSNIIL